MRDGEPWTDDELRIAVETYRFLLRLQRGGQQCAENELVALLKGGLLGRRRQSSIRYRLRNISAILADRDFPILKAYSPAPRAGTRVRAKLESMLFAGPAVDYVAQKAGRSLGEGKSPEEVLAQAEDALRAALGEFERLHEGTAPIGHNQPPESIEGLTADDFRNAISALKASRAELVVARLTPEAARQRATTLAGFGIRAAAWSAERLTKATDAGLEAGARLAARLCVLALFASLPPVAMAIETLIRLAGG